MVVVAVHHHSHGRTLDSAQTSTGARCATHPSCPTPLGSQKLAGKAARTSEGAASVVPSQAGRREREPPNARRSQATDGVAQETHEGTLRSKVGAQWRQERKQGGGEERRRGHSYRVWPSAPAAAARLLGGAVVDDDDRAPRVPSCPGPPAEAVAVLLVVGGCHLHHALAEVQEEVLNAPVELG